MDGVNYELVFYNKKEVIILGLKDRGNIKWQSVMFMPEHASTFRALEKDNNCKAKPSLDEYQLEEIIIKICHSMEFTFLIRVMTWEDGFEWAYTGTVHRLDSITKTFYLELEEDDGYILKIKYSDIISVDALDG